ncbi:MFS transporter [Parafrankia sp. BMG5.11]|uniref:MFS transporter n=1 Tax=Parafrankia sp. BMG5.11 TaxID=222540 RepID=UPI00103F06DE|nr:MFS transporter [Parafrankia sp. BMG5.11]TCJ35172.1 MFS transporter [Parafrankia sp. BMG5.11]
MEIASRPGRMSGAAGALLREPAQPARIRESSLATVLAVGTVCIGSFLGQLDASIVTIALADLRADFGVSLGLATWVSLSYLVTLVATIAALGRLADMYGRKLLTLYGFALFTVASVGAALAPGIGVLIVCRVAQALGAAMLQANSVALIATTVEPRRLTAALGAQGAAQAFGLSLGPLAGGLLLELGGWRWVFWAHIPAGVLGFVLGVLLLPRTRAHAPRTPFDWRGLALLMPTVSAVLLALSVGESARSVGPLAAVGGLVLVAALGGVLFVRRESSAASPMVDLPLVLHRAVGPRLAAGTLSFLVLFGLLLTIPQNSDDGAVAVGLLLATLPIAIGVAAPVAGTLVTRLGVRAVTSGAMVCVAGGLGLLAAGGSGPAVGVPSLALIGCGLGLFTPSNNGAVMAAVPAQQSGMASGVVNMTRGLGTALGVSVSALAYAAGGFVATMLLLAAIALGGALLAATAAAPTLPGSGLPRQRENDRAAP